jgi:hypothetical protein
MIKYCAQPGRSLHRVWLPLNSQFRKDATDPATVKINHPNPSGHAFYVHTHLHIKQDVQPEPPKFNKSTHEHFYQAVCKNGAIIMY